MLDIRHQRIDVRLNNAISSGTLPGELLIVGPAGTGKTYPILSTIHCIARDYPNLRVLIMRATRVSLTESALVTLEQEVLPADGCAEIAEGAQRSHRHSYRYPNGSDLVIAGLDRNPTRILSTAWDIVYANEAIELQQEVWETIASRMKRPGRDPRFGWLIGDTNPSYPEHWLKKRCDNGSIAMWETTHEANPVLHDGIDWTTAGLAYRAQLDKLTGPRRKRLRDGIWAQGDGLWFDTFDPEIHVSATMAEFDGRLRLYCAFDTGVETGGIWFQVREIPHPVVTVIDDYYSYNVGPERNAKSIKAKGESYGRIFRYLTDPAGDAKNPSGNILLAEYERIIPGPIDRWPKRLVADGLTLIQAFLGGDGNPARLFIHPRCKNLISAFANYQRATRAGQMMDKPKDPQHPAEDMIDSLRGGLIGIFPEGRALPPRLASIHAGRAI